MENTLLGSRFTTSEEEGTSLFLINSFQETFEIISNEPWRFRRPLGQKHLRKSSLAEVRESETNSPRKSAKRKKKN